MWLKCAANLIGVLSHPGLSVDSLDAGECCVVLCRCCQRSDVHTAVVVHINGYMLGLGVR